MTKYPHVEDYIEILAGYEPNGLTNLLVHHLVDKMVKLARYDVNIVNNMANNTLWGTALTDRQAELAVKLVLKYRKQFAKQGIDVTPVERPVFRLPVRKINRVKSIGIEDGVIKVRFPFDETLIDNLRNLQAAGRGAVAYDRDQKIWQLAITEFNVNFIVAWGRSNQFDVDLAVSGLFDRIVDCERTPYEIKLKDHLAGFTVTNAEPALIDYIEQHCGGFGRENILRLVDLAGCLGYTVHDAVLARVPQCLRTFGPAHDLHVIPSPANLVAVFDYADLTGRYPVCIYDPGHTDMDLTRFDESQIVRFDHNGKTKTRDYTPYDVKVVYARKIPSVWDFPVPLLVTTIEMMYGGRKVDWTRRAEKVVYYTNTRLRDTDPWQYVKS